MTPPPEKFLFVAGASGNTGSRAVERLAVEGWRVTCLSRTAERERFIGRGERIEIVRGDLKEIDSLIEHLRGAAAFLNLAHIGFGAEAVEACRRAGVARLISLSSTRRFTKFPDPTAERVIAGERAVMGSGLDYTILRAAMIYGGGRDNNIARIVQWLGKHSWMPLVRGGFNLVQPIYTDDLADAVVRAVARPLYTRNKALTLAGPEAITWKEMVELIAHEMNRKFTWVPVPYSLALAGAAIAELKPGRPIATRAMIRRLLEDKAFDIAEAREALGDWSPRPFREGLRVQLHPANS
jgi:uncharacterized protein YbjT (DUF2867 family)